jgi:hypothetical protein
MKALALSRVAAASWAEAAASRTTAARHLLLYPSHKSHALGQMLCKSKGRGCQGTQGRLCNSGKLSLFFNYSGLNVGCTGRPWSLPPTTVCSWMQSANMPAPRCSPPAYSTQGPGGWFLVTRGYAPGHARTRTVHHQVQARALGRII